MLVEQREEVACLFQFAIHANQWGVGTTAVDRNEIKALVCLDLLSTAPQWLSAFSLDNVKYVSYVWLPWWWYGSTIDPRQECARCANTLTCFGFMAFLVTIFFIETVT